MQAEQELERLDAMARELSAIGSVRLMVDAIHHLQGKQEADRLRGGNRTAVPAKSPQELDAQQVRPCRASHPPSPPQPPFSGCAALLVRCFDALPVPLARACRPASASVHRHESSARISEPGLEPGHMRSRASCWRVHACCCWSGCPGSCSCVGHQLHALVDGLRHEAAPRPSSLPC